MFKIVDADDDADADGPSLYYKLTLTGELKSGDIDFLDAQGRYSIVSGGI